MNKRWFLTSCRLGEVARHTRADKTIREPQPVLFPTSGQVLWESRRGDIELPLLWGGHIWTESWSGAGSREKGEVAHSYRRNRMCKGKEYWRAPCPGPKGNTVDKRPRFCGGSRGSWGWEAWPRMLVKVQALSYKQQMLTEQGSDTVSFILWCTSPGGSVDSGLRRLVAGRPTRGKLCQALSDLWQGPAESRVPHWAKAITDKLMLSIFKLRTNTSYPKMFAFSVSSIACNSSFRSDYSHFLFELNYIQVITTVAYTPSEAWIGSFRI